MCDSSREHGLKRLLLIPLLVQAFIGQAQHADSVEIILLDCITESFRAVNVDLPEELDSLETFLIKNGSLSSADGQGYVGFYDWIVKHNDVNTIIDPIRFEGLGKLRPHEYYRPECFEKLGELDSTVIKSSKFFRLMVAMDQLQTLDNISLSMVAQQLLSVLDASDFDRPFFRALALLTINGTGNIDTGLMQQLPSDEGRPEDYDSYPRLTIELTEKDKIRVNGSGTDEEQLTSQIQEFVQKNGSEHVIHLITNRGTSYQLYINIHDIFSQVYNELRNTESMKTFGKPYEDLTSDEKKQIRKVFPMHISESEPGE